MRHAPLLALAWLAVAATPVSAADMVELVVRPGDTLIGLSATQFTRPDAWRTVARLNRLPDPDRINPGQTLVVPVALMRSRAAPVRVATVTGDVRADGVPLSTGALLAEGARLTSANDASAVFELAEGSRVRLPPGSEASVAVSRVYGGTAQAGVGGWFAGAFRLVRGSVEVFAGKLRRAQPLEVQTPAAVAGVRGTEFRVHHDAAESRSRAEVLDGTVRFAGAGRPAAADLGAGVGAVVGGGDSPPTVAPLLGPPDLAALPPHFDRPLVRFVPPASLGALQVQVAADPAFDRIVADQRIAAGAELRLAGLADATWHLRARRLDTQGLAGRDAVTTFVLKARPEPPATSRPRADGKATAGALSFAWAPNVEAASARLQVARDAAFAELLIDRSDLPGNERQEQLDTPGIYWWRVASTRADGDRGPFGDGQRFELRPVPTTPEGGLSADGRALVLRWAGRAEDRQEVQLARDPDFADVVVSAALDRAEWTVPAPEQPGRYYFRYRSIEPDGFVAPYSTALVVDVPRDTRFLWLLLLPLLAL